jgi:hypothetical protein
MSGVSKVNKKSNLEKLLLELFYENENSEKAEPKLFSIESAADPNLQVQNMDIETAEGEAAEIENVLNSTNNPVKEAEPLYAENQKNEKILEEGSRGGIAQQEHICQVLRSSGKYPGWDFISNKAGEQVPDITIVSPEGERSFVEVKSREGGLVAIYDKTVRTNDANMQEFDELAKSMAKHNGLKIFEKKNQTVQEVDIDSLPPGAVFEALLTRGSFDPSGKPNCGRYGQLTVDKEAEKLLKTKAYPFKQNVYCSHKPAGFSVVHPDTGKTVLAFIPRGTGDDISVNKKIYFYNTVKKIYTEIDVKSKDVDTDWVVVGGKTYLAPDGSVRPAADAGTVSSKCFSYEKKSTSENQMTDSSDPVIKSAVDAILQHWNAHGGGGDDYFMIVSGNDIYAFLVPGKPNVLGLPLPVFNENVINSVSLTTYGKGGVNAIRLALKCDIATSITLQSVLGKPLKENANVSLLLTRLFG